MSVRWHAGTDGSTFAKADYLNAGKANTAIIISASIAIGNDGSLFAARYCNEYYITMNGITYGDWYLPSKKELNLLYNQKSVVNFQYGQYWSSTEVNATNAWVINFNNGANLSGDKDFNTIYAHPIRAF
jgi:hypothetical protein